MPPYVCDCGCVPGICDGCECETHMLDALTTEQLGDLVVKHSKFNVSDVCRKSKNELFRMIFETGCGEAVLKDGCALLRAARRPQIQVVRSHVCTPDHVLKSIIESVRSTPVSGKLISPTISKNKPVGREPKKPTKKPTKKCVT